MRFVFRRCAALAAAASATAAAAGRTGGGLVLVRLRGVGIVVSEQIGDQHFLGGYRFHIPFGPLLGDGDALAAAFAVAQHAHLAVVVAPGRFRPIVQPDVYRFFQNVDIADIAGAVRRYHKGLRLGHTLDGFLVGVLFVFQTAHQPPAGAGDLGGVQAQILGLGHFNGHRHELVHIGGAAEGPTADAKAAQHFGLIPDADLPQLNAGAEYPGQILYQFTEIHTAVGSEEEQDLAAVKAALHPHQLHLQPVLQDLLLADVEGFLLPAVVIGRRVPVIVGGGPQHAPQRLDHRVIADLVVALHALGELRTLGGLHHHVVTGVESQLSGVKIVGFAAAAKADRNHSCHMWYTFLSEGKKSKSQRFGQFRAQCAQHMAHAYIILTFAAVPAEKRGQFLQLPAGKGTAQHVRRVTACSGLSALGQQCVR